MTGFLLDRCVNSKISASRLSTGTCVGVARAHGLYSILYTPLTMLSLLKLLLPLLVPSLFNICKKHKTGQPKRNRSENSTVLTLLWIREKSIDMFYAWNAGGVTFSI